MGIGFRVWPSGFGSRLMGKGVGSKWVWVGSRIQGKENNATTKNINIQAIIIVVVIIIINTK